MPKPVIGYSGALQDRFHVDLIYDFALSHPHLSFVFVGHVKDEKYFRKLKELKKIYFTGSRKFSEIPSYINNFDVAIIPYKINKFTRSMYPLKIYEYLA